jgi:hypothetical protein
MREPTEFSGMVRSFIETSDFDAQNPMKCRKIIDFTRVKKNQRIKMEIG